MAFSILYAMRVPGVYQIVNLVNGNCYIGSSVQIESRIFKHLAFLRRGDHPNGHLQAAFLKYGEQSFDYKLLEVCDKEILLSREQFYLDALRPEYNICRVAGNTSGVLHGPEAKAKMSAANIGNKRMLGKKHSAKTRELLSKIASERKPSDSVKQKISQSLIGNARTLGHKLTEDHKLKVAAASLAMWNGDDKQARRLAASERAKARWADPIWKQMQSEKIRIGKSKSTAYL